MAIFKQKLSKKTKFQIIGLSAIIFLLLALIILDYVFKGPLTYLLTNKDEVTAAVRSWGLFGPLLFIFIQATQTIIAPIPLASTGIVGGYIFGWWGILWTTIGSALGFWLIFWLSRTFGRNLIEKIVKKSSLDKFDELAAGKGIAFFFLIFLIPGLPDDVAGYIAGLTNIPIKILLALAILGRTPSIIATNMFGAGLGEDNIAPVVIIAAIFAITFVIFAIKRDTIIRYLKSDPSHPTDNK